MPTSTSKFFERRQGRWTAVISLCLFVFMMAQQTYSVEDAAIQIAIRNDKIQVATEVMKPFYLQWCSPGQDWLNWSASSLPSGDAGCVWMRAIFEPDDAFNWEVPSDMTTVYSPALFDRTEENDGWVTVGESGDGGALAVVNPADYMPPVPVDDSVPAAARNNQAMATPDPGRVKIFWYNTSSRLIACWGLTATGALKSAGLSNAGGMSSGWLFKGLGDINRDGVDDIIWHNSNSRLVAYWILAPDGYLESSGLCNDGAMAAGWELKGVGDINRDGTVDILWHNSSTRRVAYWLLNQDGTLDTSGYCNDGVMTAAWVLSGVGDINQDGTVDLLWHNSSTRRVAYWLLNQDGTLDTAGYCNDGIMASGWEFRAVGDIDDDGTVDIFWHNATTKRVAYWILNSDGTLGSSGFCNDGVMGTGWVLEASGDINNDGTSDLLWYNSTTRMVAYWLLNSSGTMTTAGYCNPSAMSAGWSLEAAGL